MKTDCCRNAISRRSFIKVGGISITALLAGGSLLGQKSRAAARTANRLIIVELAGGNDPLNTIIPYSRSRYYDLRPNIAIRDGFLPIDRDYAFHPALSSIKSLYDQGQVGIICGPGLVHREVLSHFFSFAALRSGHIEGFTQTPGQTGWPGRMVDALAGSDDLIAGMTLSSAVNPAMESLSDKTASALYPEEGYLPVPPGFEERFHSAQQGMSVPDASDSPNLRAAKQGMEGFVNLSDFLVSLRESGAAYPETETARLFAFAARILASTDAIPVMWINANGVFDTHSTQIGLQAANLAELDSALGAFFRDLESRRVEENVVVAIISEFGRTVAENLSSGTDHGKGTLFFAIGKKIRGGFYGEYPSLAADEDGSLVPTRSLFDLPYTLAAWMGTDPNQIILGPGRMIDGLFRS